MSARDELAQAFRRTEALGNAPVNRKGWTKKQWADDAERIMAHIDGSAMALMNGHVLGLISRIRELTPRTITTAEEIRELPALTVVLYDDMANGGPLQTYVVPDDGTVMFKNREDFHLLTFGGDYIDANDMPLPLTVVYEVGA